MLNALLAYKISVCIFLLFALMFSLSRQVTAAQNLRKRLGFKRCNALQRQGLLTWILVAQLNCLHSWIAATVTLAAPFDHLGWKIDPSISPKDWCNLLWCIQMWLGLVELSERSVAAQSHPKQKPECHTFQLRVCRWAVGVVNGCSHGIFTLISWDVILTISLWLTSYNYGLWLYSRFAYPNRLCLGPAGPPPPLLDLNKPSSWTQCATPLRRNVKKKELSEANVRIC